MDPAASLPLAAAFREILELRDDRYFWTLDPKVVFDRCAEDLYKLLVNKCKTTKAVRHHPLSGWLDELGRLEGGRAVGLGVALRRAYVELLRIGQ